ncbi:MAG: hypothetical protein JO276_05280 [Sphingomonadaceae bacterium]|nr:hypothetical protein [Sphingomonadaceae bacterium]
MIARLALLGLSALALAASPALAVGKRADVSWGRAGVGLAAYHSDALDCANRAYGVDVAMRPYGPAAAAFGAYLLPAAVWTSLTPGRVPVYSTDYVEGYRHAAWVDTVQQLQAVVDSCLTERGYRRFRLTSAQMRRLRGLAQGSAEREAYLHSLGSDAQVLSAQGI